MPVDVVIDNRTYRLQVNTQWQEMSIPAGNQHSFEVNQNYYITVREVKAP